MNGGTFLDHNIRFFHLSRIIRRPVKLSNNYILLRFSFLCKLFIFWNLKLDDLNSGHLAHWNFPDLRCKSLMCILRPLMVFLRRPHSLQFISMASSSAEFFFLLDIGTSEPRPGAPKKWFDLAPDALTWSGYSSYRIPRMCLRPIGNSTFRSIFKRSRVFCIW